MDSSGRMNKTLSNVSEEQQSSNTIISVIPDLKVTNNRIHPFSPKEDADTTEFLIEGILLGIYDLHDSKSIYDILQFFLGGTLDDISFHFYNQYPIFWNNV